MERSQTSAEMIENNIDSQILTVDDLFRFSQGLEKQYYDAFLLYADEDHNFVAEVVENLEKKYNLKLCIKDRDLVAGVKFEYEAIMQLISERCNRLIVILSPNFVKSPANEFFLSYANAIGIDKRQRKVIPCIYKKCEIPSQLAYNYFLDYNKARLFDFWERLYHSIKTLSDTTKDIRVPQLNKVVQSDEKEVKVEEVQIIANGEVLQLPSVSSLDNFDVSDEIPASLMEKQKKKTNRKKYIHNCVKKVQSLLLKS